MSKPHQQVDSSPDSVEPGGRFRHLSPARQPESVHEISEALYQPFIGHGTTELKLHISGCNIDAVPFVKLASGEYRLLNGQEVSSQHADSLGLDNLVQLNHPPAVWNSAGKRDEYCRKLEELAALSPLAAAADGRQWIIWCNHVHGTLSAESEGSSVEIPFSLWATRLAKGLDKCPPYHCPETGKYTYHLAIDDDGTISDAGSIARCAETNRVLLKTKMKACQSTGQLVDPSVLTVCPVMNHMFLKHLASPCQGCYQMVDPASVVRGQCPSCRRLQKVSAQDFLADTELKILIQQQPWLKQVQKIKLATQRNHWLLQFRHDRAIWRVLVDRQSMDVCQVSRSVGWVRSWQPLVRRQWPKFLTTE